MGRWFRVHDDLVDDPKVQLLSGDMVKALLNLWCLASQNDGILPPMKDMAFKLRMKPQQVAAVIAELSGAGLIDCDGDEYRPHNWDKRQYKSDTDKTAADRSKRYREKHRDGNAPVTRDADRDDNACRERPETEQIQNTEKKDTQAVAKATRPNVDFEDFWEARPRRKGADPKEPARKLYEAAIKSGALSADLLSALKRYARVESEHANTPYLPQMVKWLRDKRWSDYPEITLIVPEMDWDTVCASFVKFGRWSKWAGPEPGSSGCRAPPEILSKHGITSNPQMAADLSAHLKSGFSPGSV